MRPYVGLAAVAVTLTAILAIVGWVIVPEKAASWLVVGGVPALLWAFLEAASTGTSEAASAIRRLHRIMVVALCVLFVVDVGSDLVIATGFLSPEWGPVARRAKGFLVGALFAAWGNHLPKVMSPWALETEPFDWQGVHRFVGRVFALAGIALMVVWASLQTAAAEQAAEVIILIAVSLGLGRKFLSVVGYSGGRRTAAR